MIRISPALPPAIAKNTPPAQNSLWLPCEALTTDSLPSSRFFNLANFLQNLILAKGPSCDVSLDRTVTFRSGNRKIDYIQPCKKTRRTANCLNLKLTSDIFSIVFLDHDSKCFSCTKNPRFRPISGAGDLVNTLTNIRISAGGHSGQRSLACSKKWNLKCRKALNSWPLTPSSHK